MPARGRQRSRHPDARGTGRRRSRSVRARFVAAAGVQCGFCIPGIALRAKHLLDQQSQPDQGADRPRNRRPSLPLHRLRQDRRRHRADGERAGGASRSPNRSTMAASARRWSGTRRRSWHWASGRTWPTCRGPGCSTARWRCRRTPGQGAPDRHVARARSHPGVVTVATAADVPGQRWYGLILQRLARLRRRRRGGPLRRRRAGRGRGHRPPHRAGGRPSWSTSNTSCCRRCSTRSRRSRRARRASTRCIANLLSHSVIRRGDADAALASSAHVVSRHVADAAHRAPVPRTRERAGGAAGRRRACICTRRARVSSTIAGRSRRSSGIAEDQVVRRARAQRRRVRRQGRHVGPGADGAAGA